MNDLETLFDSWLEFLENEGLDINLEANEAVKLNLTVEQRAFVNAWISKWDNLYNDAKDGCYTWPELLKMNDEFVVNEVTYKICTDPKVCANTTSFEAARKVEQNKDAPTGWVLEDVKFSNSILIFVKGASYETSAKIA